MWTEIFVRRVDRSAGVAAALLDYGQCPTEKYPFEHVFPPVVSTCDFARIKEHRRLCEL